MAQEPKGDEATNIFQELRKEATLHWPQDL